MNKPVIVIPCSSKKSTELKNKAYEIYQGDMLSGIRHLGMAHVLEHVELFFLSGKYGLIHANDVIENYKMRVPKDKIGQAEYARTHKNSASKKLALFANANTRCYVLLSKDYSHVFNEMNISCLKKFNTVYYSKNARGSGDHKSRFIKIIKNALAPNQIKETKFRSGCCNESEFLGYRSANEAIGTSLHYIEKSPVLMQYTIDSIKSGSPTFIDNGLITAFSNGKKLNSDDVFESYTRLIKGWRGNKKSLSIVVPDSPTDEDQALRTIKKHLKQIKEFSKLCNVIIPIHKPHKRKTQQQIALIQELLGNTQVIIGIPCRVKGKADWRMSIADLEPILEFKARDKKTGILAENTWVKRLHFFALSEKSGKAYSERADLAQRYDLTYQLDASRTCALFGAEKTSSRQGSVVSRKVREQLTNKQPAKDLVRYQNYDLEAEWEAGALFDSIRYLSAQDKAVLVNSLELHLTIDTTDTDEEIEEVFENICFAYTADFICKVIELIEKSFILNKDKPSFAQVREQSIKRIFGSENTKDLPVQQGLNFDQKLCNEPKQDKKEIELFNAMHHSAEKYGSWISDQFIDYLRFKEESRIKAKKEKQRLKSPLDKAKHHLKIAKILLKYTKKNKRWSDSPTEEIKAAEKEVIAAQKAYQNLKNSPTPSKLAA